MSKLVKVIATVTLVIGTAMLPIFTQVSQASEDPCDGPRTEFMEGWCS